MYFWGRIKNILKKKNGPWCARCSRSMKDGANQRADMLRGDNKSLNVRSDTDGGENWMDWINTKPVTPHPQSEQKWRDWDEKGGGCAFFQSRQPGARRILLPRSLLSQNPRSRSAVQGSTSPEDSRRSCVCLRPLFVAGSRLRADRRS